MSFHLGGTVPLTREVRDAAQVLINATGVILTIQLPDGTTTSPTVTNPPAVTGRYILDFIPTLPGLHRYTFKTTGPATSLPGSFYIEEDFPAYLISLDAAKAHLNITRNVHDDELQQVIEAATTMLETRVVHEVVLRRTIVENRRLALSVDRVVLHQHPVISLTSVVSLDGLTTWNVADLHVQPNGIVTVKTGRALAGDVTFVYLAGYAQVPANYLEATEKLIQHLWGDQRGDKGSVRMGGQSGADAGEFFAARGIPQDVYDLCGPPLPGIA